MVPCNRGCPTEEAARLYILCLLVTNFSSLSLVSDLSWTNMITFIGLSSLNWRGRLSRYLARLAFEAVLQPPARVLAAESLSPRAERPQSGFREPGEFKRESAAG